MFIKPQIFVIEASAQLPDVEADAALFFRADGDIFLRIGRYSKPIRLYTRPSSSLSLIRSAEGIPVTIPNGDNFVPFTHPYPIGTRYTVNPWVISSAGYTVGAKVSTKLNTGFYINPIEAGLCGYQAIVET